MEASKDEKNTVNGKEVRHFLMDNKEFFLDDPRIASKNLPIKIMKKMQVIDHKSDQARLTGIDDGE